MKAITYTSEQPQDYADALTNAKTLSELLSVLESYRMVASDAIAAAPKDEWEFIQWRAGLLRERRGKFAGIKWVSRYGDVLFPEILSRIGLLAARHGAPWGAAFIRCREANILKIDAAGVVYIEEKP